MSVTIRWRPISDQGKDFERGTSTSLDILMRAIGSDLKEDDVSKLRVMAIASDDEFFNEVADIIDQVGAIHVWGSY